MQWAAALDSSDCSSVWSHHSPHHHLPVARRAGAGCCSVRLSHTDPENLSANALPELLLKASKNNPSKRL